MVQFLSLLAGLSFAGSMTASAATDVPTETVVATFEATLRPKRAGSEITEIEWRTQPGNLIKIEQRHRGEAWLYHARIEATTLGVRNKYMHRGNPLDTKARKKGTSDHLDFEVLQQIQGGETGLQILSVDPEGNITKGDYVIDFPLWEDLQSDPEQVRLKRPRYLPNLSYHFFFYGDPLIEQYVDDVYSLSQHSLDPELRFRWNIKPGHWAISANAWLTGWVIATTSSGNWMRWLGIDIHANWRPRWIPLARPTPELNFGNQFNHAWSVSGTTSNPYGFTLVNSPYIGFELIYGASARDEVRLKMRAGPVLNGFGVLSLASHLASAGLRYLRTFPGGQTLDLSLDYQASRVILTRDTLFSSIRFTLGMDITELASLFKKKPPPATP